jgi:zinc and cadmium transporter
LILVGDALHNFVVGAVIAAAFMSSVPLSIATGIAVIAHELPQEVVDFAILLGNGFSPRRALTWNLVSGSTTIPGALLAYVGLQQASQFNPQFWPCRWQAFSTSESPTSFLVFIGDSGLRQSSGNYS